MTRVRSHRPTRLCLAFAMVGTALLAGASRTPAQPANGAAQAQAAHSGGVFPTIESEALDKSAITLPTQLAGKYNILLLSWARDQAAQIDTWTAASQTVQHSYADFAVYRIPVSAPENFLFRWWDNASLRTDETDPDTLRWTVPIYTDKDKLRRSLGVPADDGQVLALLVDRAGNVLWKAQGPSTAASRHSLLMEAQLLH